MAETLLDAFAETVARVPSREFIRHHVQHRDGARLVGVTYAEFAQQVARLAGGLIGLGIAAGDRVAIVSENRIEWALADYAAMNVGAVTAPLYPTLPPAQIAYILQDCEARVVVVSTSEQAGKIAEILEQCPSVEHVLAMDPEAVGALPTAITFDSLAEASGAGHDEEIDARRKAMRPDDTVTLIYTSGTTGSPKGVILSHRNFLSNVASGLTALHITQDDLFLSFLPLCHVFERMAGHYLPMVAGSCVAYSRGLRYLVDELREVSPTVMACVPRFYESLQERVLKNVESAPPARQRVFAWAMAQGRARSARVRSDSSVGPLLALKARLAHKLVFHKLHATVGGRLRFFISGGAPLPPSTAEFFHAAGILILEGYGLTETSPIIAVNGEDAYRLGTVGRPVSGIEVRIADDSEILTRGPHVMQGYYNLPEETAEAIDADGWFHTGDLGDLVDGYLRITGRKKHIFKLSNGKYIAPEPVESALKASNYIAEAVVIGEAERVAGALIVPSFGALDEFAKREGLSTASRAELLADAAVRKLYRGEIDRLTTHLADFEKVRLYLLMEEEFTIESGELTPTLKVKRREVLARLDDEIKALYGRGATD
jgi:long-chain acyl-CoA synthetase